MVRSKKQSSIGSEGAQWLSTATFQAAGHMVSRCDAKIMAGPSTRAVGLEHGDRDGIQNDSTSSGYL